MVAAIAALWVLPAGAGHTDPVKGTLEVSPGVVSPDAANVLLANRVIKITITDSNMNKPVFVGTGPDGQTATFDGIADPDVPLSGDADAGAGERVIVDIPTNTVGTFIATLAANPITVVGVQPAVPVVGTHIFTPLADRNDDGAITVADLEIVIPVAGTTVVAGDIEIVSIFNAERGLVTFQVNRAGLNLQFFDLRYATAGQELTRDTRIFTETLNSPAPGTVIVGENFTAPLTNQLATNDMIFPGGEATTGDATTTGDTTVTFVAAQALNSGDQMVVQYLGIDSLLPTEPVASGGAFSLALSITLLDTDGGGITAADITVISGNATVATADAAAPSGLSEAGFTATGALTTADAITIQYLGQETLTVVDLGVQDKEDFTLNLNQDWLPLQDTNGDGVVSTADVTVSVALRTSSNLPQLTGDTVTVATLAGAPAPSLNGLSVGAAITLVGSGDHLAAGTEIKVTYLGLTDLVTVRGDFTSVDGMPLRMLETGPDTGVFEGFVAAIAGNADSNNSNLNPIGTGAGVNTAHLAVQDGGAISVLYRDRSPARPIKATVQVEAQGPTFASLSPASGDTINDLGAVLTAQAQDIGAAGVNPSTLEANNPGLATSVVLIITIDGIDQGTDIVTGDIDVNETFDGSGVFTIEYPLDKLPTIADEKAAGSEVEHDITWEIRMKDNAGNLGTTNAVPLKLINRKPVLTDVFVGDNWDATVVDDPDTAADERLRGARTGLAGAALRTSIRVVFDLSMQAASFQPEDFAITTADGQASFQPSRVQHFAALPESVFLTVPELDPSGTPKVEIVGEVLDAGANALDITDPAVAVIDNATDGIAPELTAAIVSNFTKGDIQFTVESNEPIALSFPRTPITRCAGSPLAACSTGDSGLVPIGAVDAAGTNWTFNLTGVGFGRYNILVDAQDSAGNLATTGKADATAGDALTFEVDAELPAPTGTTPPPDDVATGAVNESERSEIGPFVVEIDWSSEGTEYEGDTQTGVTLTKAILDAGTDNERDVLLQSSTKDGRTFSIAIPNIGRGDHTLTYNGEDGLGHTLAADASLTFTVVAPPAFQIRLSPGMNLISVPGEPDNGSIDAIFGDVEAVDLIFTREGDRWLLALRDSNTGTFGGTLSVIDARHGYWVRSSATVTVDVAISALGAQQILPTIAVKGGQWNLVPVISLLPQGAGRDEVQNGTKLDADDYLGAATAWTRAFTFNQGRWISVRQGVAPQCENPEAGVPADDVGDCGTERLTVAAAPAPTGEFYTTPTADLADGVQVGRGYWVFYITDSTITP